MSLRKPCPFCGSDAGEIYMNDAEHPHWRVKCINPECDALGPIGPIMGDEDFIRWNARIADQDALSPAEKDIAVAQAVEFAQYVEQQAKGAMRDAAARFLSLPYSQEIAERLEYPEAARVCAEAYQAVGSMLSDLGQFDTPHGEKLLDNLSEHRLVHDDVLPWPSFEDKDAPVVFSYDPTPARATATLRWPDGKCLAYSLNRDFYTDNLPAGPGVEDERS